MWKDVIRVLDEMDDDGERDPDEEAEAEHQLLLTDQSEHCPDAGHEEPEFSSKTTHDGFSSIEFTFHDF